MEGIRQRNTSKKPEIEDEINADNDIKHAEHRGSTQENKRDEIKTGTYWLTRIVLLRYLGFIYVVAFLVALHQNRALIGKGGLLPADRYLREVERRGNYDVWSKLTTAPTVLWFLDYKNDIDNLLDILAYAGLALAGYVMVMGSANIIIMLVLWALYHSIVNVGQRWYSFGWESQLLETGFLGAFLCPLLSLRRLPRHTPTPLVVIWGYRWLIFRIMLGAGLIKIRGDKCWWPDLTCMNYHYETQPVPNPISYFMHQEPEFFHKFEVLSNHFVELIAPFLLIMPRRLRFIGGGIQILFQVILIISGNLSFLNWLTIVPSLACFDDASLAWMFSSKRGGTRWCLRELLRDEERGKIKSGLVRYLRKCAELVLGLGIAYLSIPIVQNLMSSQQVMNTSFDPLRIVNTYGAFGSVTKERTEIIMQGTYDVNPHNPAAKWETYEFKCKPGDVNRRPCLISPYHYRLDWLMWFAAFQNYQYNPWLVHLAAKLLVNDEAVSSLIAHNPFEGREPPKFIRCEHYRYSYTKFGSSASKKGAWWKRTNIGNYLPPVSQDSLKDYLKNQGWPKLKAADAPKTKKKRSR